MTNRKIKVVKRDTPPAPPAVAPAPPIDSNREVSNTVKEWISERRKNRLTEESTRFLP